ncbi:hypothetical protein H310_08955 [Aphanomyces invadans]|uniref:Uncharacterized protein n=1 Tax=Aphanomyces invadans TaxID=157072 RepID=A0A024TX71_9STRA|nr:hypothetical protein H310_08955 [Aphanomyces invadans]ETV98236.1 hypothetical protein H310_08955 [Aphanomyces invadans]|eukprot:XP_008873111.1 hypothetical protein H310_08955 [Aphanomyces invadans]
MEHVLQCWHERLPRHQRQLAQRQHQRCLDNQFARLVREVGQRFVQLHVVGDAHNIPIHIRVLDVARRRRSEAVQLKHECYQRLELHKRDVRGDGSPVALSRREMTDAHGAAGRACCHVLQ